MTDLRAPLALTDVGLRLGAGEASVTALSRVSITAAAGELIGVVGPSGSGKSSLLAVAGGLLRPTTGSVEVVGIDLARVPDRLRTTVRQRHIGYVFQQANLLPSLTSREQLLLMAHIGGGIATADRERADELLAAVGMAHRADRRPHQLSGGERQRVGIARSLMTGPAVLLVDEPTSALDRARAHEIVALIADQTHTHGTATIMVTHDTAILDQADRVLHLRDGVLSEVARGYTARHTRERPNAKDQFPDRRRAPRPAA